MINEIKKLVGAGELSEAIDLALNSYELEEFMDELLMLKGRYQKNETESRKGTLSTADYSLVRNQIASQLLELINIESSNASERKGIGQPQFEENTKENFEVIGKIFVGKEAKSEEGLRVESICWDFIGKFLITNTLEPNSIKVWCIGETIMPAYTPGI